MGALAAKITAFVVGARPVIIALVAAALLINGGALIYPSERGKERAKDALPWVVAGSAIALGAVAIASSITSGF